MTDHVLLHNDKALIVDTRAMEWAPPAAGEPLQLEEIAPHDDGPGFQQDLGKGGRKRYCFHAAKASLNARSPGVPFSTARMARRLLA